MENRKINDYDLRYDIRLATLDDINSIMMFINVHWRNNHIMATNRELFEYEYVHNDEVDFVIAVDKNRGSLEGIFGFLRCSKERTGDIWGSMWKVNDNPDNMNLLGIELAKRVYILTGCRSHIGNGANPKTTIPLRKVFFRDKTVKMKQYYWLNDRLSDYSIATINERWIPRRQAGLPTYTVEELSSYYDLISVFDPEKVDSIPHKDAWYIKHRFFDHPIYEYKVYAIKDRNECDAIFVTREIVVGASSVLRIVDYIGNHQMILGIFDWLNQTIINGGYEYIDFYEYGISDDLIESVGFRNREDSNNIIPNYFEPFVKENVDIWAHYSKEGTTFFKADGDQDRPNALL